jgi:hypothetical protein
MILQIIIGFLTLPLAVMYAIRQEYYFHRLMHKKVKVKWKWLDTYINYPYYQHAKHHARYRADRSYNTAQQNGHKNQEIIMSWPLRILVVTLPSLPFWLLSSILSQAASATWGGHTSFVGIPIAVMGVLAVYHTICETMHYLMHVPAKEGLMNDLQHTQMFQNLCARHLLHHQFPAYYNFNVVVPWEDKRKKTYRVRSRCYFNQAPYPAPNVQPHVAGRPGACIHVIE